MFASKFFNPQVKAALTTLLLAVAVPAKADTIWRYREAWNAEHAGNYDQAFRTWKKLAKEGDPSGQTSLGKMYYKGQGVTQDYKQALAWFQKGADQGNAGSQYFLGLMYEKGHGVAQDYKQAFAWYKKSADQGKPDAQYMVGLMYEKGLGVAQDYQQAVWWYKKATQWFYYADAHYALGNMYYKGLGVAKDYQQAKAWWQKVLAQPDRADTVEAKKQARIGMQQLENMSIGE